MQITRENIFIAGAVVLVALAAGYFLLFGGRVAPTVSDANTEAENAVVATSSEDTVAVSGTGDYTVEMTPVQASERPAAPDFAKPLAPASTLSASERATLETGYAQVQAQIRADAFNFDAWISLGTLNMMAGDYQKARVIWEYVSEVWPGNQVSSNNLGDLYANYLRDYPKAEANYLKAIQARASDANPYRNLFVLYSETSYKPTNTAAEDILKKGIAAVPKAVELQVLLARYYTKLERLDDARAMYAAAAVNAESQGNAALAAQIRSESSSL